MFNKYHIQRDNKFFVARITLLLALLTALSPFAIDTYMPALPVMSNYFGVPINLLEITITLYFLGVAVGQIIGGPLSDSFGRKKVAVIGLFLFAATSILSVFVKDVHVLWGLRFVQAIGGGFASVVNMAFIRDWFEGKEVARMSSLIGMIMMLAPLVAPVVGTFLLLHFGWPSIFIFMFIVSSLAFILFVFLMPESRKREHRSNKISLKQVGASYVKVFHSKKVVALILSNSFAVAGMFVFLTGASFLYIDYFKVKVSHFPLFFGSNVVLNVLLTLLNYRLVKSINPEKILRAGLLIQFIAGVLLLIAVEQATPNLWFVFLSIVLFIGSLGLVFSNAVAIIINQFPQISGSANAVVGVIRFALSALIGSIFAFFHAESIVPLGIIMFSCTLIANAFYLYSKKLKV